MYLNPHFLLLFTSVVYCLSLSVPISTYYLPIHSLPWPAVQLIGLSSHPSLCFEASLFANPVLLSVVKEFSKHVMVFNHSVPQTAHYSSVEWQHYMAPAGSEQTTFC